MMVIHKYQVHFDGLFQLMLPRGARVLRVDVQDNKAFLWSLHTADTARLERRCFVVFATGQKIDSSAFAGTFPEAPSPGNRFVEFSHVGTFFAHHRALEWHLFEVTPAKMRGM